MHFSLCLLFSVFYRYHPLTFLFIINPNCQRLIYRDRIMLRFPPLILHLPLHPILDLVIRQIALLTPVTIHHPLQF